MLTDLNKLVGLENRDAYEERNIKQDNPTWTEWDRFVKPEYKRIESTADDDSGEVLNWENDDWYFLRKVWICKCNTRTIKSIYSL